MIYVNEKPVIMQGNSGTEGNKYSFERGRAVKINNEYNIFTMEIYDNPLWTITKIGYWKSRDG